MEHGVERRVALAELMDLYKPLLTERTAQILTLFADEDLSLTEIADTLGISRQGVYDAVHRGEEQLMQYERQLGFGARLHEIRLCADSARNVSAETAAKELDRISELCLYL